MYDRREGIDGFLEDSIHFRGFHLRKLRTGCLGIPNIISPGMISKGKRTTRVVRHPVEEGTRYIRVEGGGNFGPCRAEFRPGNFLDEINESSPLKEYSLFRWVRAGSVIWPH